MVHHQSDIPVFKDTQDVFRQVPILLCVLNQELLFSMDDGDWITYEESGYGALLSYDGNSAFAETVAVPAGNTYQIVGEVPDSAPLYVYATGDKVSFRTELLPDVERPKITFWWMGKGVYYLHSDRVWRSEFCLSSVSFVDASYFVSTEDALSVADEIIDVLSEIESDVRFLGLSLRSQYANIEQNQCQMLAEIGNRWKLAWCWSKHEIRRVFRRPLTVYSFSWSYGGKS